MITTSNREHAVPHEHDAVARQGIEEYRRQARRHRLVIVSLIGVVLVTAVLAINAGAANTTSVDVIKALLGQDNGMNKVVIWNIRLPRVTAAIVVGIGLAVSGVVMQTTLRNALASPFTLGISNAAAFGANLAIVGFGAGMITSNANAAVTVSSPAVVATGAFIFSMLATLIIIALSKNRGFSPETVVLAGVALGSLFTAGSTLIQYFADDVQIAAMVFWTFGDLGRPGWREVTIIAVITLVATIFFMFRRWDYNALDAGEDAARSLGVNVARLRMVTMLVAAGVTAIGVSFTGIIGFIGLIAPHMMRRVVGIDHRFLIPASALAGAALLLIADTLARTMISPIVLPVGALTSFFGAPLFLWLLMRKGKQ
ncbi:MAG: iron ABC transporter permease [Actinomycetaceae bacterium]|nr:iron ABC transporter permease [Actinomycetaceae bacterium]